MILEQDPNIVGVHWAAQAADLVMQWFIILGRV